MSTSRPADPKDRPASVDAVRCSSCGVALAAREGTTCSCCKTRVCLGCAKPYGHFMLACDDCRLGEWR